MSITEESLQHYNIAVEQLEESSEAPQPILLLQKYRVRLLPIKQFPILETFANSLDFSSENGILIDMPTSARSKRERAIKSELKTEQIEQMDTNESYEEDKENSDNAPMRTSFLTYEKLRRASNYCDGDEIVGFSVEQEPFDCNPVDLAEAIVLRNILCKDSKTFATELSQTSFWISTNYKSLPSTVWLAAGKASKNIPFTANTRILGFFDENSEKLIKSLNNSLDATIYAETSNCRAVYEFARKMKTENRPLPGELLVDVRWKAPKNYELLTKPINNSECNIKVDLGWRDPRFYSDDSLFQQVFFVLDLAEVLADPEKEAVFNLAAVNFDELVVQMNELIETCSNDEGTMVTKDEEVTEKVWNVVRQCSDIKQVTQVLRTFLQALTYGKIKSQVHENNKSLLASLIKSSKQGSFRMPRLERLNTIEMLMEIGVETLRRHLIAKFTTSLSFDENELEMALDECENYLKLRHGAAESRAISLLPISMTLAAVAQIHNLLHVNSITVIPGLTRNVLGKFTKLLMLGQQSYTYETPLPLSRLNQTFLNERRPRFWTCETTKTLGCNLSAKMISCLELESSLAHVNDSVNAVRPIRKIEDHEDSKRSVEELRADYVVSHTLIAYYPKSF